MQSVLFNKAKRSEIQILGRFTFSQYIEDIMKRTLQYGLQVGEQLSDTVLSCTRDKELDFELNSMKREALSYLNKVVRHFFESSLQYTFTKSPFFPCSSFVGKIALVSLRTLCTKQVDSLEDIMNDQIVGDVIVCLLRILATVLEDNNFYFLFSECKNAFIIETIFLLLKTTKKEKETIDTDPQNFANLSLDLCDQQLSGICKTEACKLLESIVDHIDGALTFVFHACSESLDYACSGCDPKTLSKYPHLAPFASTSYFLLQFPPDLIIDVSLVALTEISYLASKRKDLSYILYNMK